MTNHDMHKLREEALQKISTASTPALLNEIKNHYFARRGVILMLMAKLKELPNEQKRAFGQAVNELKTIIENAFKSKEGELSAAALEARLATEKLDVTIAGKKALPSSMHPFHLIKDEMINIFVGMGYNVVEGTEVEEDDYNFTLLNIPLDHPARDMQDTFYISTSLLLRTHTSPSQARVMQASPNTPIKMISPGKVYRRDEDDNTHSHQFGQIEGLVIDKDINLGHLKATLNLFVQKMFGSDRKIRFRSSYFPFTEPSVEVDVSCHVCGGKGCSTCKQTGYIEILGAGVVNPLVLELNGYDPAVYSGFAFGIGIERVAMLRFDIDDIRRFYQNDIRFLNSFPKGVR